MARFCVSTTGEVVVIPATGTFEVLARNPLREKVQASLALANKRLILRTANNLYCIGGK